MRREENERMMAKKGRDEGDGENRKESSGCKKEVKEKVKKKKGQSPCGQLTVCGANNTCEVGVTDRQTDRTGTMMCVCGGQKREKERRGRFLPSFARRATTGPREHFLFCELKRRQTRILFHFSAGRSHGLSSRSRSSVTHHLTK